LPFSYPRKQENAFPGVSCSKNFWGGGGACPQTPLDAQTLSGLQNVAVGHVFHCYR